MRIHYEPIGFKTRKSGICPVCGKMATRVEEFYQTINPWNRKTAEQIMEEERKACDEWRAKPTFHAKCEYAAKANQ